MRVDALLDRLDRVKQTGKGCWIARCPNHEDKTPSLSIKELNDGRILIHDFGGCGTVNVLESIGMSLGDLFPTSLKDYMPNIKDRKHWHAAHQALVSIADDALLIVIGAENIANGVVLTNIDRNCLIEAATRIRKARKVVT